MCSRASSTPTTSRADGYPDGCSVKGGNGGKRTTEIRMIQNAHLYLSIGPVHPILRWRSSKQFILIRSLNLAHPSHPSSSLNVYVSLSTTLSGYQPCSLPLKLFCELSRLDKFIYQPSRNRRYKDLHEKLRFITFLYIYIYLVSSIYMHIGMPLRFRSLILHLD